MDWVIGILYLKSVSDRDLLGAIMWHLPRGLSMQDDLCHRDAHPQDASAVIKASLIIVSNSLGKHRLWKSGFTSSIGHFYKTLVLL